MNRANIVRVRFLIVATGILIVASTVPYQLFAQHVQPNSAPSNHLAAIIAGFAAAVVGTIALIGSLIITNRSLAHQRDALEKQIGEQQKALKMQLDLQRYSLEKQLSAQRELLERQQNQSREEVRIAKLYSLTEEFAVNVAAILHSMLRGMWPATQNGTIDKKRIESYNKEAYTLLPKITALQATIAALDMTRLDDLRRLVNQIYELDADIGRDGALLKGPPSDQSELSELHARALRYHARANDLKESAGCNQKHTRASRCSRPRRDRLLRYRLGM